MTDFTPGPHLLIDHRGDRHLTDADALEAALRGAAEAAGAEVLSASFHAVDGGVSGALILAEGHVAVRTWAKQDYASFDVFIPGEGRGKLAADHLARALLPDWTQIRSVTRNDFTPATA
ncbi:S-adenosylmethionine decarboxylase [Pseudooceanicola onchidii]|uniref:S-adenosylmethionine decarboxylase n=1 Tax=Pseudooceanicola onchidii TaxID=2562279 RepID=UPI0010AAC90E|nr:S-adenosylmethionine decarboxylase [Pseudooceanicola onchidii]